MDYISEKISKDPVTGKLYVGKKPGDDQAPDAPAANATASATPQPEKKGMNFSLGGVDPTTGKNFLGVQPGRDPADTFTGRLANLFIPRRDKETGRLYMGTQVGRDPKRGSATPAAATPEAEASATATPADGASATATPADGASATATPAAGKSSGATPKLSAFGAAFKAAREARLSGKGGDTFEFGGKKYHSYQAGEKRPNAGSATPAASAAKSAAAAVPASSNEPPLSDTERKAIQREKDIGRTGTVALDRDQVLDKFSNDLKIGADKRAGERKFDSRGVIQKKPQDSSRFSDTKVFTTTTRTPGANSTVTTRNGGTTSTVQISGGGTTETKLNDTRTEAEKASDEAKATAEKNAIIAAAKKNYAARQKSPPSVNESIESYKGAFRAVLAEGEVVPFKKKDQSKINQTAQQSQASAAKPQQAAPKPSFFKQQILPSWKDVPKVATQVAKDTVDDLIVKPAKAAKEIITNNPKATAAARMLRTAKGLGRAGMVYLGAKGVGSKTAEKLSAKYYQQPANKDVSSVTTLHAKGDHADAATVVGAGSTFDALLVGKGLGLPTGMAARSALAWGAGSGLGEYGKHKGDRFDAHNKPYAAGATRIAGRAAEYGAKTYSIIPHPAAAAAGATLGASMGATDEFMKNTKAGRALGGAIQSGMDTADKAMGYPLRRFALTNSDEMKKGAAKAARGAARSLVLDQNSAKERMNQRLQAKPGSVTQKRPGT